MPPPRPRVTIQHVARAVGVSPSTVSVVLNGHDRALGIREATRLAVLEASERLGYRANHAARSLRRRRTNVLSLLVQALDNPCFVDIAVAAREAADTHGYELNVIGAGPVDAELRALDRLHDEGSDGVIVATGRHSTRPAALQILHDLVTHGLRAVVLLDHSPEPGIPAIRVDVELGARLAVEHLLGLGHRRIAHLALQGPGPIGIEQSSQGDRFRGYRRALLAAGIDADPDWLVRGQDTLPGGYLMMNQLLDRPTPRPTAALVYNDITAIGALRALHERGLRVPDDMAVIGTDGIDLSLFTTPALTTVDHPREVLGRYAVEVLCELLDGREPPELERVFEPQLVVRESCGARTATARGTRHVA
ncbi:MAG: LacI family DNA-binding transcriptional regulator [Chloroflexi bacterium]|nr:LacI family DNA-binding transcriptional regulator [Chloroflexota bacterium]MBV9603363.1 LacI family DNA-binding transcriptional regulator [Chloroflexota bacterium]